MPEPALSCGQLYSSDIFSARLCRSGLYPLRFLAFELVRVHCVPSSAQ